jgi:hypothetical protein
VGGEAAGACVGVVAVGVTVGVVTAAIAVMGVPDTGGSVDEEALGGAPDGVLCRLA